MNILGKARKLESKIARTINDTARRLVRSGPRNPLETVYAIVDEVEAEVQPAGRGKWLFPFNRIKLSVVAATRDERARLEAILDGQPDLQERIQERLRASGCQGPDIEVRTIYVGKAQPAWVSRDFHLEFARVPPRTDVDESGTSANRIEFAIVHGTAQRRTYSFGETCIDLGRGVEVRDSKGRLIRTNQIAFSEGGGAHNQSVSRRHAHVVYDAAGDHYRVLDDGSAQGTTVVREGRSVAVPHGSRGIRLQSGDEIVLGEARVRVKIVRSLTVVGTDRPA